MHVTALRARELSVRPTDIASLIGKKPASPHEVGGNLGRFLTLADLERRARRALPRPVFDYLQGGADAEESIQSNVASFRRWDFVPRALQDVSDIDMKTTILGSGHDLPIGLAPTGYTRLFSAGGEHDVARAAFQHNIPYVLSTMATTAAGDLAGRQPNAHNLWFQLYVLRDREQTTRLIEEVSRSGFRVLELAIDTAVSGNRLRDRRNGFTIPPRLTTSSVIDIASKPPYWMRMIRQPALTFANLESTSGGSSVENIGQLFDNSLTWSDIEWLRGQWHGPLLVKGPLDARDVEIARGLGVDGVHLSNHGGRQLDRTIPPVELVREVRAAVGEDFTIVVDSGVRHGSDVAVALALGADAAFIGRPYLWGLAAAGEPGVVRAIQILREELMRTMQLLGMSSVAELRSEGSRLLRVRSASGPEWPGRRRPSPRPFSSSEKAP